ncbi:MAG: extracellular solute-binding protein, partial [Burkholderiales bacterium]
EAFKLLKAWHKNISSYSRQGVGPIKATARGENMVAVAFIHDVVTEAQAGFPVKSVAPCEGTGYEIGSMSIIKGARNLENARKFYDWALTPAAQKLAAQAKSFQLPSNVGSAVSPLSPKPAEIKLIDYNFAKYGSSAERKRLLERWEREVGSTPK